MGLGVLGRSQDAKLKPLVEAAIAKLIRDHDDRVVIWARMSQLFLFGGDEKSAAPIAALVRSPEAQVRLHAVRAIGSMGPKGKFAQDRILSNTKLSRG